MKNLILAFAVFCSGCASYVTPGGPAHFADINRADIAAIASIKPSPNFPARLAVVRIQAPQYKSYSAEGRSGSHFSVVTTQELLTEDHLQAMSTWPSVAGVAPLNSLLLPQSLESLDDLRLAAAKIQGDILLVYTIDTTFRVQGRGYGPLSVISLGLIPDRDAYVTSTASALLTDVRTGFVYGVAESTAKASGLTNAWGSSDKVDKKRIEAEQNAFTQLVAQIEKTWTGIVRQYK